MTTKRTNARLNNAARSGRMRQSTEKKRADAASLQEPLRVNPYTRLIAKLDVDRAVREGKHE